jgi:hypothetical protein
MRLRSLFTFTVLLAAPASAQTTIETSSIWDGLTQITAFGKPHTSTYGQTFIAPTSDNVLQSFSFYLRDLSGGGTDLQFQGYVSAFDPTIGTARIIGPLLFQSAVRTGPTSATTFTRFDFDVGGLALTPGSTYVAFLSTSGLHSSIPLALATSSWGWLPTSQMDAYADGTFVFNNNADNFGLLSTTSWTMFGGSDLAFDFEFDNGTDPTVIPEPSAVVLTGTGLGLLLLGIVRQRRRQQQIQG